MNDVVDASETSIAKVELIIHGVTHIFDDNEYPEPIYVTYGQGCSWFKASVTTSRAPIWDIVQEFSIRNVNVPIRVRLHRERVSIGREQVIGRLKISLESAAKSKERSIRHTKPFPPLRGTTKFGGYLSYQCYVTEHRPTGNRVIEYVERKVLTGFDAVWNGDMPMRIPYKVQRAICLRCRRRSSQADDDDLVSMERGGRFASLNDPPSTSVSAASMPSSGRLRRTHSVNFKVLASTPVPTDNKILRERRKSRTAFTFPTILSVEPNCGSVLGGARIAIRGTNLGLDAQDLTGVYICGSNCLSSLEYESDQLVYCTTKAWRACTGQVTIMTASGGRSQGSVKFSFVDKMSRNSKKTPSEVSLKAPDIQHRRERSANIFLPADNVSDTVEWSSRSNISEPPSPIPLVNSGASLKATMLEKQYFMVLRTVEESTQTNETLLETGSNDKTGQSTTDESSLVSDPALLDMNNYIGTLEKQVIDLKIQNAHLKMQLDDLADQ